MLRLTVDQVTAFRHVLDLVGDKWSSLILAALEDGPKRFNEIERLLGDISHRVLTRKLRDLERDGYVSRTIHPMRPPKVEYALTRLGRSLLRPVKQFLKWTLGAFPEIRRARAAFDRTQSDAVARAPH